MSITISTQAPTVIRKTHGFISSTAASPRTPPRTTQPHPDIARPLIESQPKASDADAVLVTVLVAVLMTVLMAVLVAVLVAVSLQVLRDSD